MRTNLHLRLAVALAAAALLAGCGAEQDRAAGEGGDAGTNDAELAAAIEDLENAVAAAKVELERLRDYDEIGNLLSSYGYYVDKSRHDDVADLFTADAVYELLGRGVFLGQDRIREYQHNFGPVGPREGSLFNHMVFQSVISLSPDGQTAHARSRNMVMFGIHQTNAQWGGAIYENVLVKEDGTWKFDYVHAYQTFYTVYEDGWAKRASPIFAPYDRLPPDQPQSVQYDPYPAAFVPPFHYLNPVSGRRDHYADPSYRGAAAPE